MKKLFTALVAVAAVTSSCGPTEQFPDTITVNQPPVEPAPTEFTNTNNNTNTNVTTPSTPRGSVSGVVTTTNLSPLADADVELIIGSAQTLTTKTDMSGAFRFADVPAGSQVLVNISKNGFARARVTTTVPSSAGNVPIDDANASFGPIQLAELNGTVRFVVSRPDGRPAAAVRASLRISPVVSVTLFNNDTTSQATSHLTLDAVADAQGQLVFNGVPTPLELTRFNNAQYQLYVSPLDADNDGFPETGGYVDSYSASTLVGAGNVRFVTLGALGSGGFWVESSNVGSLRNAADNDPLRNTVRTGESLQFVFSQPVQPQSLVVRVTNEYGASSVSVTPQLSFGNMMVTVPLGNSVSVVGEYNIDLRAISASGLQYTRTGFFFFNTATPTPVTAVAASYQETSLTAAAATQLNNGEAVFVHFSAPIAFGQSGMLPQVFFNADIGGPTPGVIGDFQGERGAVQGFTLIPNEPTAPVATRIPVEQPVFPLVLSGYTTRWSFAYQGAPLTALSTLELDVAFSKIPNNAFVDSFWSQPVTSDFVLTGVVKQPVPVP